MQHTTRFLIALKANLTRFLHTSRTNKMIALSVAAVVMIAGYAILRSNASGLFVSVEPEDGRLNGTDRVSGDATASGDKAVQYGAVNVPSSMPSDCSGDITDKLNSWLATVPDGSTIVFARNGCYQLDRTFHIDNRENLILEGNGATLRRETPTPPTLLNGHPANTTGKYNQHILIFNSKDITLRNLNVLGLNTVSDIDPTTPHGKATFEPERFGSIYKFDRYGEAGLFIKGSDTVTVTNFKTDGTWGDGISLGNDNGPLTKNVTLKDITVDRNGRQGVAMASTENALLDNVNVLHSHAIGFDLEPNGANSSVKGIEIRNSYINAYTVAFGVSGTRHARVANDDIYVHDNIVRSTLTSYPWFNGSIPGAVRSHWRITNNTVLNPTLGIFVSGVTGVTLEGNRQPIVKQSTGPLYPGVRLTNVAGPISIRGNEFLDATTTYTVASSGAQITACSNKLTEAGAFNQPGVCR